MISHTSPLMLGPADVAGLDPTRKSITIAGIEPTPGRVSVNISTPLVTEAQTATITLGGQSKTFSTTNSITGNLNRPDGADLLNHESGWIFDGVPAGPIDLEIDLSGGAATLWGVSVRSPDPLSGIVEDQGTGEHCGPLMCLHSNGSRYSVHADMVRGRIFAVRDLDGQAVEVFPERTDAEGGFNEKYHRACAVIETAGGNLLLAETGHNLDDIKLRLAVGGDLSNLTSIRTIALTACTYLQLVRLANGDIYILTRATEGVDGASVLIRLTNADSLGSTTPTFTKDVIAASDDDRVYPQFMTRLAHEDGRELLGLVLSSRNQNDGTPANWDRAMAALFDPAASKWWAMGGTAAAQNAGLGTGATPRFSDAQVAGLTSAGAGITVADGANGTTRYTLPGGFFQVTQWPTAGSAAKGRAMIFAVDSPGGADDYSFPHGYATLSAAESTGLVRTNPTSLAFPRTQAFSVGGWFYATSLATTAGLIGKRDGTQKGWMVLATSGGNVQWSLRASSTLRAIIATPNGVIVTGRWYHVLCTYDGSGLAAGLKTYLDGVLQTPAVVDDDLGSETIHSDSDLTLGCLDAAGTSGFTGRMCGWRVWDRELSADDRAAFYNFGVRRNYAAMPSSLTTGMAASYDLSEASNGSGAVTRADSSGNGLDLTDFGTTVGTAVPGATFRVFVQDEDAFRASGVDFDAPPIAVSNSYRLGLATSDDGLGGLRMLVTDRGLRPIGTDGLGEGYGVYLDWGSTTLAELAVGSDWSAPTFAVARTVDHGDELPISQLNAIEGEPGAWYYPRALNQMSQNHRQALATVLAGATPTSPSSGRGGLRLAPGVISVGSDRTIYIG